MKKLVLFFFALSLLQLNTFSQTCPPCSGTFTTVESCFNADGLNLCPIAFSNYSALSCFPSSNDLKLLGPFPDVLTLSGACADVRIEKYRYAPKAENALCAKLNRYFYRYVPTGSVVQDEVIVIVHGGGFCGGGAEGKDFIRMAMEMALEGYEVLSIEYRRGYKEIPEGYPTGCTGSDCAYCEAMEVTPCQVFPDCPVPAGKSRFDVAVELAVADARLAIEVYNNGLPAPKDLVFYGNSAGAYIGYDLLTADPTWANDNNFVLGVMKSGSLRQSRLPAGEPENYSVPLFIISNPLDNTAVWDTGKPFEKYCCDGAPLAYGGKWFYEKYTAAKSGSEGRAVLVTICDGGHGDNLEAYSYPNYLPHAMDYYNSIVEPELWTTSTFWDNNNPIFEFPNENVASLGSVVTEITCNAPPSTCTPVTCCPTTRLSAESLESDWLPQGYRIYDLNGNTIFEQAGSFSELDPAIPAGVYFLEEFNRELGKSRVKKVFLE